MHHTLPETNILVAPEHRPKPKRKGSSSNHRFSGDMLLSGSVHLRFMGFSVDSTCSTRRFLVSDLGNEFYAPKTCEQHGGLLQTSKMTNKAKSCKKKGLFSWFNIRPTPDITYIAVSVIYLIRWVVEASDDIYDSLSRGGTNNTKTRWYCWWGNPAPVDIVVYPIIYRCLDIPDGAGFLPSTVVSSVFCCHPYRRRDIHFWLIIFLDGMDSHWKTHTKSRFFFHTEKAKKSKSCWFCLASHPKKSLSYTGEYHLFCYLE